MKLTVNAPINSVSFGNVSYNIIREFYKKNFHLSFFPIGDKIGFEAFDKVDQSFAQYVNNAAVNRLTSFDVDNPSLSFGT